MRTAVRQNAPAFWTPKAPRRGQNSPEAVLINLSGRACNKTVPSRSPAAIVPLGCRDRGADDAGVIQKTRHVDRRRDRQRVFKSVELLAGAAADDEVVGRADAV